MWISKASAKQRRGRAGRTKAGVCFHLFSRRRHDSFREFLESELLRTSLEEICLQCKKLDLAPGGPEDDDGIPAFLASALTPPHKLSVSNALEKLVELGAMEVETNELTPLGQCLSCLSVSPEVGKMIIWSYILGCSKDASSMAVAMSYKSPFIIPPSHMRREADEARVELSQGTESDQVLVLKVLQDRDNFYKRGGKNQFHSFCRNNFINFATIQMIADLRNNIARELTTIGFPDPATLKAWYNRNDAPDRNLPFLQSTIVAGLYPNVATRQEGAANFSTSTNRKSKIHIGSVNACKGQYLSRKSKMLEFIAYGEMVKGSAMYTMNQTTHLASIIPIMLLCGSFHIRPAYTYASGEKEDTGDAVMSVDEWISFQCDKSVASSLSILRRRLDAIFHHIISNPKTSFGSFSDMERMTINVLDAVMQSSFHSSPGRW
jgi:ATP-dependent RNA helicase DHX36